MALAAPPAPRSIAVAPTRSFLDFPRDFRALSRLSRVVTLDIAAAMLHLPSSNGLYFRTIRIESERREAEPRADDDTRAVTIGPEQERVGEVVFNLGQLKKHLFCTGCTGSGKTVSIENILAQLWEEHGVPFLILAPIVDPYRKLLFSHGSLSKDLRIYSPGKDSLSPFRFNPFEVPNGMPIETHINALETCFNGAFEMWGSLPILLREGIEKAYRTKHLLPTQCGEAGMRWPTMDEVVQAVGETMEEKNYAGDLRSNIQTSLDIRLKSLCRGTVGRIFASDQSLPGLDEIQNHPVILELDALNQSQQNLLSLFIMNAIRERLNLAGSSKLLKHLIVIEESQNLIGIRDALAQASPDTNNPRAEAVRFFVKCLAETRDLGQGYAIIDQSPAAIAPDVLKNTSIKIVHRTVDEHDRDTLASAMLMDRRDHEEVARLRPGDLYVYHEDLYRPVQARSLHRFGGVERPDDRETLAIVSRRGWFKTCAKGRKAHWRSRLDKLLADLRDELDKMAAAIREPKASDSLEDYSSQVADIVSGAVLSLDEAFSVIAMDPGAGPAFEKTAPRYYEKLLALQSAYLEEISKPFSPDALRRLGEAKAPGAKET